MSLLTSLLKAGTQLQQAATGHKPAADPAPGKASAAAATVPAGNDDRFTPTGESPRPKTGRLAVGQYRQQVGQDLAYVKETLRHKLAEYGLRAGTQIAVHKGDSGTIEVQGRMPEEPRLQIQNDLNHSQSFREAFGRLALTQPTLTFVDTALKLNQAYGASNTVLDSLVSDNAQFNGLQDLVHRYDSVRKAFSSQFGAAGAAPATEARGYSLSLNTQA